MSGYRLPAGGLVDRGRPLSFTFDGRSHTGFQGDTLASALIASGLTVLGRSFKYHRPRGLHGSGPDEPNALVELRTGPRQEPNTRATEIELYDGLVAASQNRFPSLAFDILSMNSVISPIITAGFYYKTFKWPRRFWERVYEPLIRRAAGLGRIDGRPDPDGYETATLHCDVLVVGTGPAGLAAALAAARAGARVVLADRDIRAGGRLLSERHVIGDRDGPAFAGDALKELAGLPGVRILLRTEVFGAYDGGTFGAVERVADHVAEPAPGQPRQRTWTIVARQTVIAAGSIERPVVFSGNDRPGVMTASALRGLAIRHGVAAGRSVALFTATDDGWSAAADLAAAGVNVTAVIDPRRQAPPVPVPGARVLTGSVVREAFGRVLRAVEVVDGDGRGERIACDVLGVSGGHQPDMQLATHLGASPIFDPALGAFVMADPPPGVRLAGAAAGRLSLGACLADGHAAGEAAAAECGHRRPAGTCPEASDEPASLAPLWHVKGGRGKAFVDLQNDVTADDIALAAREGYVAVEHLKRYTTLGMATDQGRTSNQNGIAILAALTGQTMAAAGTVRARPPVSPVAIGALAGARRGRHFRPTRLTPTHAVAVERGAVFMQAGAWERAAYFPRPGEDWLAAATREATAVRTTAGVTDMSTLGKIEVAGPDAAAFLHRLYANDVSRLAIGRCAYGLMLREDGFVMDDGTVARLSRQHFVVTCSTAHAADVYEHMEFCRQVLWPGLDVSIQSVSEAYAQLALAGPAARAVLERIVDPGFDVSPDAMAFLGCATGTLLGGVPGRLFRISFSGELAFEIAVPAGEGARLMREILDRGADLGVVPYGIEALNILRIEKGHPAGGELDGRVTAHDLGLGAMAAKSHDCIGRQMAARPALTDPGRQRLVGLVALDGARLRAGAHLIPRTASATAMNDQGRVSSATWSPVAGAFVALAFLENGPDRHGEVVRVVDPLRGADCLATVGPPCLVDPAGDRVRERGDGGLPLPGLAGATASMRPGTSPGATPDIDRSPGAAQERAAGSPLSPETGRSAEPQTAPAQPAAQSQLADPRTEPLPVPAIKRTTTPAAASMSTSLSASLHPAEQPDPPVGVAVAPRRIVQISAPPSARAVVSAALLAADFAAVPTGPHCVRVAGLRLAGTGPDRWLVIGHAAAGDDRTDAVHSMADRRPDIIAIREAVAAAGALVTDQSDARVCFAVGGPMVRRLLERTLGIDMDPGVFGTDAVAVTEFAGLSAIVWREDDAVIVAVPRSVADDARHLLDRARLSVLADTR